MVIINGISNIHKAAVKAFAHLLTQHLSRRVSYRKISATVSNVFQFQVKDISLKLGKTALGLVNVILI